VPVRQLRVAELDVDVAVLSSGQLEEAKRDSKLRQSAEPRSRGRGLSSVWQIDRNLRKKIFRPRLRRVKRQRFFRVTVAKPRLRKKLESSSTHLGNLTSDCSVRVSFTGARVKRSRPFSQCKANHSKKWRRAQRRLTKTGEAKGNGLRERILLGRKNSLPRGSDRRRREPHRSFRLQFHRKVTLKRTEKTTSTGAVGQVVGGSRRQHAS
jgi:hypothetical protein